MRSAEISCSAGSVHAALRRRRSTRGFCTDPVSRDDISAILEAAGHAPSGGNVQPFHTHVLLGSTLTRLSEAVERQIAFGEADPNGLPSYPYALNAEFSRRRRECGEVLYRALGIARLDREGRRAQFAQNARFFGAPVGLIFTLDGSVVPSQWIDLGIFMQSIMLAAAERGLGTCAQAFWSHWPTSVREHLGIGAGEIVAAGMALGLPDTDARVNHGLTSREPIAAMTTWHGDV